jgi:hypothetical protein
MSKRAVLSVLTPSGSLTVFGFVAIGMVKLFNFVMTKVALIFLGTIFICWA